MTNAAIKRNTRVYYQDVPLATAKTISGVRAVFGEVYPDPVRVVSVGFDVTEILKDPTNPKWATASIEFCGGTHVFQTGDIKRFAILEETAISKGIRRIVAVTGEEAAVFARQGDEFEKRIAVTEGLTGSALESAIKVVTRVCGLSIKISGLGCSRSPGAQETSTPQPICGTQETLCRRRQGS